MKRNPLKVRHVAGKPSTPYMVAVPKFMTGTRRVRKFFKTQEAAEEFIARMPSGFTQADTRHVELAQPRLRDLVQLYLLRLKDKKPTLYQARRILGSLSKRFGRDAIETVGHENLDRWLQTVKGSSSNRHNYYRVARRFFGWCRDYKAAIQINPMLLVEKPDRHFEPPHILSPQEMSKCLMYADGNRPLMAYLTLGGFAGCRTEEILRMSWDHIDWDEENVVHVMKPKKVKSYRPRPVEVLPVLRRHLEPIALKGDAIDAAALMRPDGGRGSRKVLPGGQRSLFLIRKKLVEALGLKAWPRNCLRHSFKAYHEAFFQNRQKTQLQMGHSDPDITRYVYGRKPVTQATAALWWAL